MQGISDKSIDMILCDLPYGTTACKWDKIIPFEPLWEQYKRVIKDNGAIVLTAQTPFDKVLGVSGIDLLKYEWIWIKQQGTGFLNSKKMPLKATENILVFYKNVPTYNPQMRTGFKPYVAKSGRGSNNYREQRSGVVTKSDGERFPLNWIEVAYDKDKLHPTQKPVALFEYFIKTYTNENETVLDNCSGSGTTAIACINTSRNYICIEKDKTYFDLSIERVNTHKQNLFNKAC